MNEQDVLKNDEQQDVVKKTEQQNGETTKPPKKYNKPKNKKYRDKQDKNSPKLKVIPLGGL